MRHKHADLIISWANGEQIQVKGYFQGEVTWSDCTDNPHWATHQDYRIKPEPKPDIVGYCSVGKVFESSECILVSNASLKKCIYANLKITFCGETGALKSAEVLK